MAGGDKGDDFRSARVLGRPLLIKKAANAQSRGRPVCHRLAHTTILIHPDQRDTAATDAQAPVGPKRSRERDSLGRETSTLRCAPQPPAAMGEAPVAAHFLMNAHRASSRLHPQTGCDLVWQPSRLDVRHLRDSRRAGLKKEAPPRTANPLSNLTNRNLASRTQPQRPLFEHQRSSAGADASTINSRRCSRQAHQARSGLRDQRSLSQAQHMHASISCSSTPPLTAALHILRYPTTRLYESGCWMRLSLVPWGAGCTQPP